MRDGQILVSSSRDHTIRFWDVASGRLIQTFTAGEDSVTDIEWTDDSTILSSGPEGRIKLWNFGRVQTYRDMQPKVDAAQKILQDHPNDPSALQTMAQWWDFRGVNNWAVELYELARANGAKIPVVQLARCYWNLNEYADAKREFTAALADYADPDDQFYLKLCIRAVGNAATQPSSTAASSVGN
jgi:hypothetical protein